MARKPISDKALAAVRRSIALSALRVLDAVIAERDAARRLLSRANKVSARARKERDELRATFDLRWKADLRAIKLWQQAHPGNDLTWPDHADMVVWLLGELEKVDGATGHHWCDRDLEDRS